MGKEKTNKKKGNGILTFFKGKKAKKILLLVLIVLIAVGSLYFLIAPKSKSQSKVIDIGLKDIGELNTQSAIVTIVQDVENPRKVFGMGIPFTNSHFIFSYDFEIKAGFQVEDITPSVDETKKTVTVTMPHAQFLGEPTILLDSEKVYLENESIFNQFKISDHTEYQSEMAKEAKEKAEDMGILEAAEENAETILKPLFEQTLNSDEYTFTFNFK